MYYDAFKIGAATIALGLFAYAGYAGAVEEQTTPAASESCKVTKGVKVKGHGVYDTECTSTQGDCIKVENTETCEFQGSAAAGDVADEPISTVCVIIGGRRYCKSG